MGISQIQPRPRDRWTPVVWACALGLWLGCGGADRVLQVGPPEFGGGEVRFEIRLGEGLDPASLDLWLDGEPLARGLVRGAEGWIVSLDPDPGPHRIAARAHTAGGGASAWDSVEFVAPPAFPALAGSWPEPGAEVSADAWLVLDPARPVAAASLASLGLACDGRRLPFDAERLDDERIVVNPTPALPEGALCALAWRGEAGVVSLPFATRSAETPNRALYDRTRKDRLAPFPDDFFQADDASRATGRRLAVPVPDREGLVAPLFDALLHPTRERDGWSPLAPLVVEVSAALDPERIPQTVADSLDPLAAIQLLDLDAGGERVPFRAELRSDATPAARSHLLIVIPARPLDGGGRYALVATQRAGLQPDRFFRAALDPADFGEAPELDRVRARLGPALEVLQGVSPRIPREDLALLLPVTVGSSEGFPDDILAMRGDLDASPAPDLLGFVVEPEPPGSPLAAVVRGTWAAPDWRPLDPALPLLSRTQVVRDSEGAPRLQGTRPVEFVLALPEGPGPHPVVVHQHGNPGDQEEALAAARAFLAGAGFAVIGFTDVLNREVSPERSATGEWRSDEQRIELQVSHLFVSLFVNRRLPEYGLETTAEQLAFLRFVGSLADVDVLPLGAPDGVPDLDLDLPLGYHGVSEGANHGQALLAYAPEIRNAALVAGGERFVEALLHQQADAFVRELPDFVPGLTPAEIWVGLSLLQTLYDPQDRHNHLAAAAGEEGPSVLLLEGLDDRFVPNGASESAAWALGLPQLGGLRPAAILETAEAPLQGNLGPERTGALVQLAPRGLPDLAPSAGCADTLAGDEGHFCVQSAAESQALRVHFFRSGLGSEPPEILDPRNLQ